MSRRKTPLNTIIDAANILPLPQVITAYPLDWLAAILGKGSNTFFVARTLPVPGRLPNGELAPYSGLSIQLMLRAKGVRMWANWIMVDRDRTIMFTVRGDVADWAAWLLTDAGIPYQ